MVQVTAALAILMGGFTMVSLYQRVALLERTILALSEENETAFRTRYSSMTVHDGVDGALASLDGTVWEIRVMPINAEGASAVQPDQLAFANHQVSSKQFAAQGTPDSNYTLATAPGGTTVWETMQTDQQGKLVWWRGEWKGLTMRGMVTQQAAGHPSEQFTFVGVAQTPHDTLHREI